MMRSFVALSLATALVSGLRLPGNKPAIQKIEGSSLPARSDLQFRRAISEGRNSCQMNPELSKQMRSRSEILKELPEQAWKFKNGAAFKSDGQKRSIKKAYFINLDSQRGRLASIQDQFKIHSNGDVPLERFPAFKPEQMGAIVGKNATEFTDVKGGYPVNQYNKQTMWSAVAVYYSHARLLKKIYEEDPEGEDIYMIMEDDSIITEDWKNHLYGLMDKKKLPQDWDLLRMAYWGGVREGDCVTDQVFEMRDMDDHSSYNGNLIYAVRPKSIPMILSSLRNKPIGHIDGLLISRHDEKGNGMHAYATAQVHAWMGGGEGTTNNAR